MKTRSLILLPCFLVAVSNLRAQSTVSRASTTITKGEALQLAVPKYSDEVFSGFVVPHYSGNDLGKIYDVLDKRRAPKDEYESTDEYRERLHRAMTKPIIGRLLPDGVFAFVIQPSNKLDFGFFFVRYDADKEEMIVGILPQSRTYEDSEYRAKQSPDHIFATEAMIWREESTSRSYLGSNAFGASTKVTSTDSDRYSLLYDVNIDKKATDGSHDARIHMSASEAKASVGRLRVLVVCRIKEVPVMSGYAYDAPTFSDPIKIVIKDKYLHVSIDSIWVFDDETGVAYAKSEDMIHSVP